jgi:hypothetical protein
MKNMDGPIQERDWKFLREIHDEMLHRLCSDINRDAAEIACADGPSSHEQYLKLYRHIHDSDAIIGECFNDWRRSTLSIKILKLRRQGLLTDSHVQRLSPSAQDWLHKVEEMEKNSRTRARNTSGRKPRGG